MKKTKLFLTITVFLVLLADPVLAQTQQVISTAGQQLVTPNAQIDYTIGEPVVTTIANSNNILTQGFHQSKLTVTGIENLPGSAFTVLVYPNPTENMVNIEVEGLNQQATFSLFDAAGKLVAETTTDKPKSQMNFADYAVGNYLLQMRDSKGKMFSAQKIIKSNL